jgi:RHH-type transcriptional regulator, rel operon repressor / antitoxin RelB
LSIAVSVRIPEQLANRLDHIAQETERPKSFIIPKALEAYLEDYADLQPAMDRQHDKADAIITSDEMRKSLGL